MTDGYRPYTVTDRAEEAPGVFTFFLRPAAGERPPFSAGQFVNIALPGHTEAKSYTIASAPQDDVTAITVRVAGNFSTALIGHKPGDTLALSAPLGYFCAADTVAPRLWLAGGIGVTPFMSMLRDRSVMQPPTLLYYSNRTVDDMVFKRELAAASREGLLQVRHFLTREPTLPLGAVRGRIAASNLDEALGQLPGCHVYMCGSIGFVRDYWSALRRLGVAEERLFTEAFF